MGWFGKAPKATSPTEVGAFLCAYTRDRLVSAEPTTSLRGLLNEDGVPRHCRQDFDGTVFVLMLFIAFVAARRRYPIRVAEAMLAGALAPFLAVATDAEKSVVSTRLQNYREFCPSITNQAEEIAAISSIACAELFDSEGDDVLFQSATMMWASGVLRVFDDFWVQTPMRA